VNQYTSSNLPSAGWQCALQSPTKRGTLPTEPFLFPPDSRPANAAAGRGVFCLVSLLRERLVFASGRWPFGFASDADGAGRNERA